MDKREHKKRDILQAGLEVMYRNGYNGTGVKDIVDAAGIPKGSFYNYFESKEAFVLEALETVFQENMNMAIQCLRDTMDPPLERIRRFFQLGVEHARVMNFQHGCFMGNMCQEMADVNEVIRARVDSMFVKLASLLESCLREASEAGEISTDRDLGSLAEFLLLAWEGALLRVKAAKNDDALKAFMKQLDFLFKPLV